MTDEVFKTFWHYFQNILVMLAETISSQTMELVLSDKEMDIFNCSFTQTENVLILSVNEWALQCSKQNLIASPFLVVFFSINLWPSKIPNGPLKMMEGANNGPQKFWPGYNTEIWYRTKFYRTMVLAHEQVPLWSGPNFWYRKVLFTYPNLLRTVVCKNLVRTNWFCDWGH